MISRGFPSAPWDTMDREPLSFAALIWHDSRFIYIQMPISNHVEKFEKSDGGLHKALKLLDPCEPPAGYVSGASNLLPAVKRRPRRDTAFSEKARARAREAMNKAFGNE